MGDVNWVLVGGLLVALVVIFQINKSQKKGK